MEEDMDPSAGPDAEFQDPRRREMITEILKELRKLEKEFNGPPGSLSLKPGVWALFWLTDMEKLEEILQNFKRQPSDTRVDLNNMFDARVMAQWLSNTRSAPGTPKSGAATPTSEDPPFETSSVVDSVTDSGPKTPKTSRGKKRKLDSSPGEPEASDSPRCSPHVAERCKQRDRCCVLTQATNPIHASHIVPFSLRTRSLHMRTQFWRVLRQYWTQERISRWEDSIFRETTETTRNLITLAPGAHKYWDDALFALKPLSVSPDGKALEVQFYWLCPGQLENLNIDTSLLPEDPNADFVIQPPTLPNNLGQGGQKSLNGLTPNVRLYNCNTDTKITSGQRITLTTTDPVDMPLPSWEILQLHWLLHRVLALCAAAGYLEYKEGENENYYDYSDQLVILPDPDDLEFEGAPSETPVKETSDVTSSLQWLNAE